MSTSKFDSSGLLQNENSASSAKHLTLPCESVSICKNGIEFPSAKPLEIWTEMSIDLESPKDGATFNCQGIVVSCDGDRHKGYVVSMVFLEMTPHQQQQLGMLALSHLG